jgi:hypothetical protein
MALEALPDAQGQPLLHKPFFAGEQVGQQHAARRNGVSAQRDTPLENSAEEHNEVNYIKPSLLFPTSNKPSIKIIDTSFKELIDSILR